MAEDNTESDDIMLHCASCGVKEDDGIKLKKCTACYLVRYCGVKCQKDHRPKHKKECKKRAAELRDEILFKQPESSYYGDCPICCLPVPLDTRNYIMPCCSKYICNGCYYANQKRELEGGLEEKCPFCRHPVPKSEEAANIHNMKRVEANDPFALSVMGGYYKRKGDDEKSFEYWTKAAAMGSINAHYNLSRLYRFGEGVGKNEKKELYHLEKAVIGGHADARYDLGIFEGDNEKYDRAIKHWIIAANMGHDKSLSALKDFFKEGFVTKEDYEAALRGHKAAVDATKSPQREEAEKFDEIFFRQHMNNV